MDNINYNSNQLPNGQFQGIPEEKKPIWAAVTGFVLSLVNIVFCCCCTDLLAPAALVFCILSLVKKWRGTGLAVSGIVISSFAIVYLAVSNILFGQMSEDLTNLVKDSAKYAEEYRDTGELPMEYRKYTDPKYDRYWAAFGYDSFEEFYRDFVQKMDEATGGNGYSKDEDALDDDDFYNYSEDSDDDYGIEDFDFGEDLIDI